MLRAIALATLAQSSLLLGGLLVYWIRVPPRIVGVIAGFGAGALISSVSFDLVGSVTDLNDWQIGCWLLVGAAIFVIADRIVERRYPSADGESNSMGIVVGAMVDGVPESMIFGMQVAAGVPVAASFFAAVLISNSAESMAPSADLAAKGWPIGRTARMWTIVLISCAVASGIGYLLANSRPGAIDDVMSCIAAGGLLAMLTDSLMPFAFERARDIAGVATVVGFAFSILIS